MLWRQRIHREAQRKGQGIGTGAEFNDEVTVKHPVDVAGWLEGSWIKIPLDDAINHKRAGKTRLSHPKAYGPYKAIGIGQTKFLEQPHQRVRFEIEHVQLLGAIVDPL